ncbi:MAG: membrane protein insertion efficiency factor YidD [Bacteroidales bacterium]
MKHLILILTAFIVVPALYAQNSDRQLAANSLKENYETHDHHGSFLINKQQAPRIKYNPMVWVLGGGMYIYQNVISPQLSASCYYEPSCSSFSRALIAEYGLVKGVFLTADRVSRCNRIAALNINPLHLGPDGLKVYESLSVYKNKP